MNGEASVHYNVQWCNENETSVQKEVEERERQLREVDKLTKEGDGEALAVKISNIFWCERTERRLRQTDVKKQNETKKKTTIF